MEVKKEWLDWLASGDTGISSKTMLSAITGIPISERPDVPGDIADVGRCVRMLRKCPDLRGQLQKVIDKHKEWMPYIDCWKELEKLYDECVAFEAKSEEEKKAFKKKRRSPNEEAWELIQKLECASRYLRGMRIQNDHCSWKNQAPQKY